jgi:hypothetical protein
MKYLERYKVFEAGNMKELHEYLDDLLLPFSDLGYKVTNHTAYGGGIGIIGNFNDSNYVELRDDLIRVLEYIKKSSNGKLGSEVNIRIKNPILPKNPIQSTSTYQYSFNDIINDNISIKDDWEINTIGIGI